MVQVIHRYLDRSTRPTYFYERAASLVLELLLLIAATIPAVTGWRSAFAAGLVAGLRLYEAEVRREDASVMGRHRELGGVDPLPPEKALRAAARGRALEVVAWTWPGLVAVVQAAESGRMGAALVVSVVVTLARVAWGRRAMPAWRRSRLEWRTARKAAEAVQRSLDAEASGDVCEAILLSEGPICNGTAYVSRDAVESAASRIKLGDVTAVGVLVSHRIQDFDGRAHLVGVFRRPGPKEDLSSATTMRIEVRIRGHVSEFSAEVRGIEVDATKAIVKGAG